MTRQQGGKKKKGDKSSLHKSVEVVQRKSVFGRYSEAEMLALLKGVATDPRQPQFSLEKTQPLRNEILGLRKVMLLNETEVPCWRKRKLQQFVKDKLGFPGFSAPNQQNGKKLSRDVSSDSCSLLNSDTLPEKQLSRESANCLIPLNHPTVNEAPTLDLNGAKRNNLEPPRRSIRLLNFIGEKVVPVGPRFQADVPEWNGRPVRINDSSRWLGSRVWPLIEIGNAKSSSGRRKVVGKGRPNYSCRCVSPGSVDCIRCHILKKSLILQCDLGPAFFSWKLDEMGEQVLSKSWTLKEQQMFESLVSKSNNFMKRALMRFPKKSSKEIVHYYFNVFIPQHMSQRRRLSLKQVHTDNEEDEEDDYN